MSAVTQEAQAPEIAIEVPAGSSWVIRDNLSHHVAWPVVIQGSEQSFRHADRKLGCLHTAIPTAAYHGASHSEKWRIRLLWRGVDVGLYEVTTCQDC